MGIIVHPMKVTLLFAKEHVEKRRLSLISTSDVWIAVTKPARSLSGYSDGAHSSLSLSLSLALSLEYIFFARV